MQKLIGVVLVVLFFGVTQAQTYIQLILDLSGSMYEKLESGEPKIDAARLVLTDFISKLPDENLNVGLRVYGATTGAMDAGACEDSQLAVGMQGVDKDALLGIVSTTNPKGATPIAYSLQQAVTDFQGLPAEAEKVIVLVTDGEESCGGDLQAALAAFESQGIEVDLRIVGLGLSETAAQSFEGVGATFENALDTTGFATALTNAVEPVQSESTPQPTQADTGVGIEYIGTLEEGKTVDYLFTGYANVPVLFTIIRSSDFDYTYRVLDSKGREILKNFTYTNDASLPFTPQEDGEYIFRLIGVQYFRNGGDYTLRSEYAAGSPTERKANNRIEIEDSFENNTAPGAFEDYTFTGFANVPVLFSVVRSLSFNYSYTFLDSKGRELESSLGVYSHDASFPFTPQEDGDYTLRFKSAVSSGITLPFGLEGSGSYKLISEYVAGAPTERKAKNTIEMDGVLENATAVGAFEDYVFTGTANVTIVFSITRAQRFGYNYAFLDDEGNELESTGMYVDDRSFPFTPQEDGVYTFRLKGIQGFGEYKIFLELGQ